MKPDQIWNTFEIAPETTLVWDVGATCFYASRASNDWLLAQTESDDKDTAEIRFTDDQIPADVEKSRWAFKNPRNKIMFAPAMPDRPLVVSPISPLGLPPESEVQFYVNIPAFIKISIANSNHTTAVSILPTQGLSNTWFGDHSNGILCYTNKSQIRREKAELSVVPNQIICPFKIKNRGDEILHVERICLRVKYLSIWAGAQRLWSNEVTATFRGHGKESQLEFSKLAPKDAVEPKLIVKPEEKAERGFLRQTFSNASFPWKKETIT